ncbi:flagellin [Porticoccaceae bacterium]|nr:flagellin [Porticoccaceae bacterium]
MSVINTNVSATLTSNALAKNDRAMSQSMERLSTGQRINSASDDAAGLAIASKMTSQIRGLDQAVRNGNDAISMVQTADGALVEVSNMLQRMRELAVQSVSDTNTSTDRTALNTEFTALTAQIEATMVNTQWNGQDLLDGDSQSLSFQVGANASQTITVTTLKDMRTAGTAFSSLANTTTETTLATLVITDGTKAANSIKGIDSALAVVNTKRAELGSTVNRLEYAVDNLANVSQNASASRSRVQDANYATESTELARTQIIQQAGTAMLAQANQQSQSVLALLK